MTGRGVYATLAVLTMLLAGGCSLGGGGGEDGDGDRKVAPAFVPTLEDTACPPQVDDVLAERYSCQLLTVRPEGDVPAIRLLVTKVEPEAGPADPIIVVGEDVSTEFNYAGIAPVADRIGRTVYFLNPRGVVGSEPSLECPEADELVADTLAAGADPDQQSAWLGAVQACHARLREAGVDLSEFGQDAMARDVLALAVALGAESWSIGAWGSAGQVALRVAALRPDGLSAVFLDAPSVPADDPRAVLDQDTRRGLDALFAACERDPDCRALPHSLTDLDRAVRRLDRAPLRATLSAGNETYEVLLDGTTLMRLVRQATAFNGQAFPIFTAGAVPAIIAAATDWRPELAETVLRPLLLGGPYCDGYLPLCADFHRTTLGSYLTSLCHDHDPFPILDGSTDAIARFAANSPYLAACNSWAVDEATEEPPTSIGSDVPVLAVVGEYTPYSDVERVRAFLADDARAHVIEVPGWGHNAIAADPCIGEIRQAFFEDPTAALQDDCLADIAPAPEFLPRL